MFTSVNIATGFSCLEKFGYISVSFKHSFNLLHVCLALHLLLARPCPLHIAAAALPHSIS